MPAVMPRSYATLEYVHSRIMQNYSQVVDLRWCISIHSCEVCPFQSSDAASPFLCQAVHYGICTPVRRSLLRSPARLQQPPKCQFDFPVHVLQGLATCRKDESSTCDSLGVVHNSQRTEDTDGVSFLHQKRIELLQRREQQRKQQQHQHCILQRESQRNVTSAAGVTTTPTSSGSKDSSLNCFVSSTPPKLPTNPAPLAAGTVIGPVTKAGTSTPVPLTPFAASRTLNHSSTAVVLSSPKGFLSDVPVTSLPSLPLGTSPTCLAPMTQHNCFAVESPALASASVTSVPLASSLLPIISLIAELETVLHPISKMASSCANNFKQSQHLTSSNVLDSFLCVHDTNSNRVEPERLNHCNVTGHSGQTLITKESSQALTTKESSHLEPFHSSSVPQFHFPAGCSSETVMFTDVQLSLVVKAFEKVDGNVKAEHMDLIAKACGLPLFWKYPLFRYAGGECEGTICLQNFLISWNKLSEGCHDSASMFVCILAKPDQNYLEFDDFVPFIQDIVNTHPGLAFLEDAVEFHTCYIQTVIARIFYSVSRSWSGRITLQEIRKSNLLQTICHLEDEEDINQSVDYFSYEHFYVIYCKFWELDLDHDFLLTKVDLLRHNDQAINSLIIDRIFSGAVTRNLVDGKLSFPDFVWFLISEEDKCHPRSVEYWFRCMDLDGDGILSMYELECFYTEQVEKMDLLGIDVFPFCDCLCQMLDMIQPKEEGKIRLSDLKSCSLAPTFFDTFINLDKYLAHEHKDPFASLQDPSGDHFPMTDWEKFAADEYEMLLVENSSSDYYQEEVLPLNSTHAAHSSQLSSSVT